MKHTHFFLLFFFFCLIPLNSCRKALGDITNGLVNGTNSIIQILDQAANNLNGNAENFNNIIEEAIAGIEDQDVKNDLELLLSNAITLAGTEIRCNIQFTVDYLLKGINSIKAELLDKAPPAINPVVCVVIPASINMKLRPNDRDEIMITGYFLDKDFKKFSVYHYDNNGNKYEATNTLSLNTDFKLIINLGRNGITLDKNSNKLVLMWDDIIMSEIPVIQPQLEPCKLKDRTLTGLGKLIVYPEHKKSPWVDKKGDKEFNGNGPCTMGWVRIYTNLNSTELWATLSVTMWECPDNFEKIKHDYTYGDGYKTIKLYTADIGWKIKSINGQVLDEFQNIDQRHDRTEEIGGSGPVSKYLIEGDTSGSDLGSSRVEASFANIKITLEEVGDCIPN